VSIKNKDTLKKIASTAIISKSASASRDLLADVAIKAVTAIAELKDGKYVVDKDNLQVIKKQGGSIVDTQMVEGIIVDKEVVHPAMPKLIDKPKIALVDAALEVKKTEIDAKIEITDPTQLQAFLSEEEKMLKTMVEHVVKSGANVLFCQKGIDDLAQHFLAKEGIYGVRRVKKSDMEKLAKATGANIVSKITDLNKEDLGTAGQVEERKIGEDKMTFVTGCKGAKSVSLLIRGGTEHVVDELERSMNDATSAVSVAIEDSKTIIGGGAAATEIALGLREYAQKIGGREQIAIEEFANAVEIVPRTLAENAGMDPIDTLIELRKRHSEGKKYSGVDVHGGKISDMKKLNVIEPYRVGKQAILSATDAAIMILRIDDVIASKAMEKTPPPPGGGPPGGGLGEEEFGD
jgi:chaperonin GroEL (HSP60 family)